MSYTQVLLQRDLSTQVTYIPTEHAQIGDVLQIWDSIAKEWDDGWTVAGVYQTVDEPPNYRKMIRAHRRNTGDSLPKVK